MADADSTNCWRRNDPEAYKAWRKQYLAKNRDKVQQQRRNSYKRNADKERVAARKYRAENREKCLVSKRNCYQKHKRANQAYARKRRKENREFLDGILRQAKCVSCGEADYRCLQFHHLDPQGKDGEVSGMIGYSRARLIAEISKCEIRCKNCHLRTHAQDGIVRFSKPPQNIHKPKTRLLNPDFCPLKREINRRYKADHPELVERNRLYQRERYRKNKELADKVKAERGCEVCGERDMVCLQFHHRDPEERVAQVAALCGFASHRLLGEIGKCAILCGNCHDKRHYEERRRGFVKRRVRQLELPFDSAL